MQCSAGIASSARRCENICAAGNSSRQHASSQVDPASYGCKLARKLPERLEATAEVRLKTSEGLDAINLTRDEQPDLILMDIKLPDISGFDVTRLLKRHKQTKAIPIIAVTAFATSGDEIKALESGCDAYIPKPISFDKLLRTIQSFLPSSFPQ